MFIDVNDYEKNSQYERRIDTKNQYNNISNFGYFSVNAGYNSFNIGHNMIMYEIDARYVKSESVNIDIVDSFICVNAKRELQHSKLMSSDFMPPNNSTRGQNLKPIDIKIPISYNWEVLGAALECGVISILVKTSSGSGKKVDLL